MGNAAALLAIAGFSIARSYLGHNGCGWILELDDLKRSAVLQHQTFDNQKWRRVFWGLRVTR
jgi:hypothetical protein